ncbi:sulfite reductase (NADPH) hemoprotein beta-component [Rhizobiales bacterium GAS191]|nr:sulfite reductase (NADPH) hemoprotein beta-component [Rhizobiales bacterium GAS113]SEC43995.1 sulfite reductase (NADPH) hemoprotein beta-component [Rhizobiales bacterium GAS191]
MYRYDEFDARFVRERVAEFRSQVERRLDGALTEDEFRPLRLQNGLYLQLHAYMLRIAVPYGTLSARQMRQLAVIADRYDRGYGHFTTRQNLQFNWPKLKDVPDILGLLADVEMHAIQTSGNCIRNVTADHFAGVAADEVEDPRPTAELIRQWSSLHPEFSFLPRKFKIAVTGAEHDRAVIKAHDIGLRILRHPESGELGYQVIVGGGLGRTPMIGKLVRDFLPKDDLLAYLEAIMRVYNLEGRRDNKYKARVKILVHEIGAEEFSRRVEQEFAGLDGPSINADPEEVKRIAAYFAPPPYQQLPDRSAKLEAARAAHAEFARFLETNVTAHRTQGYAAVTISLKPIGGVPGDATSEQMRIVADLAERYSFAEIRVSHIQNLVLPHVRKDDLFALWEVLDSAELATANSGLVTDIIACPGLDYCALATARSIPIAQSISRRFADSGRQREIGPLGIKISGCINACGHHHVGHIGILGLEKNGAEYYQLTLGGDATEHAALGERLGPGLAAEQVPDAVEKIVDVYLASRAPGEEFIETYRRVGIAPFRDAFQGELHAAD